MCCVLLNFWFTHFKARKRFFNKTKKFKQPRNLAKFWIFQWYTCMYLYGTFMKIRDRAKPLSRWDHFKPILVSIFKYSLQTSYSVALVIYICWFLSYFTGNSQVYQRFPDISLRIRAISAFYCNQTTLESWPTDPFIFPFHFEQICRISVAVSSRQCCRHVLHDARKKLQENQKFNAWSKMRVGVYFFTAVRLKLRGE